ncbi:MAG: histidinol dehydrogenase [bacterium]
MNTREGGRLLRRITPDGLPGPDREAVDRATLDTAAGIVEDVRARGEEAVREHAVRLGELEEGAPWIASRPELEAARERVDAGDLQVLESAAERIRDFACAQFEALGPMETGWPGGRAGHRITPVRRAGCYIPGGRFPLPSSALMTVITARTAGVEEVWAASPRPADITLAAAAVAGADALIRVGGAQAVAALAWGAGEVPPCDVVVGPGSRWTTAAKQLVSGRVGIDMLAGPSELVVLADGTADPDTVAADLLAQAEHDPDALPVLVSWEEEVLDAVDAALARQLKDLPTAAVARQAVRGGFAVAAADLEEAAAVCDRLAPEHLQVVTADPEEAASRLDHYGALFIGEGAAEVFGDYGAGPNHVLPTGGTARYVGGLSVFTFLRVRTWMRSEAGGPDSALVRETARLARLEGLEAHARAAERRLRDSR